MRAKLIFLGCCLFFSVLKINAQCTPEITSPRLDAMFPDKVVFCTTENETLSVTQTYDSYQWYKQEWDWQSPNNNPWIAIPNATSQTLTINGADDMLYYFKVAVTQADCSAESPAIMADGYAYGLPFMMADFTPGTFQEVQPGEYNVCSGATVQLDNGFPLVYGTHTWFKCIPSSNPPLPNDPCIVPGATGDTFIAHDSGEYGFYACTEYCPEMCEMLSDMAFIKLNFGAWGFCSLRTGETKPKQGNDLMIYPNPTTQFLYIGKESEKTYPNISIIEMSGKIVLQKQNHQYTEAIDVSKLVSGTYFIISKNKEGKVYKNKFIKK